MKEEIMDFENTHNLKPLKKVWLFCGIGLFVVLVGLMVFVMYMFS